MLCSGFRRIGFIAGMLLTQQRVSKTPIPKKQQNYLKMAKHFKSKWPI